MTRQNSLIVAMAFGAMLGSMFQLGPLEILILAVVGTTCAHLYRELVMLRRRVKSP